MKYLMFIKHTEDYRGHPIPQGLNEAMGKFVGDSMKSGVLLDTGGLKPTSDACEVRLKGGKITVVDGPFTESKEMIGGYALMNVKSDAEARALATEFMELHRVHWPDFVGSCEVRPCEDYEPA
jgi:hypothetical protein